MESSVPVECEMPGAGYDFQDVTRIFLKAGAELEPDNLLFMENFTLQESMSALEIGEPRLDSGLLIQEQIRPPFTPTTSLLPEEICWILDRALAYETEFHAGNFLAHTVHTLLYVHHLPDIDPEVIFIPPSPVDPARPIELVTVILRAAVQGLLKCCDLAWRELAKGGMYDTEDWQSDKCEVSLLESTPAPFIISKLEDAVDWLADSPKVPAHWKPGLQARLLLRRSLIQVMNTDPTKDRFEFQRLVFAAKGHLHTVKAHPSPDCGPDSPAQLAFDPYIGRRLQMATPIRVVPPPSFDQTYGAVSHFLDGLYEIGLLETVDNLTTWETAGNLRLWLPDPPIHVPYIRSLTQTTFYDGFLLLNKYSFEWMINRFFCETIGISYDSIKPAIIDRWIGEGEPPIKRLERSVSKLITPHIRSLWNNPPRRRRHLMKTLVEWHALYDTLVQITDNIEVDDLPRNHIMSQLDKVPLLWQLSMMREIVLSGFQLELYAKEERAFAYWYAANIVELHLKCLDDLLPAMLEGSSIQQEMTYQVQFLTALQSLCMASSLVSMPLMSFDWQRLRPNFFRRYKWASGAEYDAFETPVVVEPSLHEFIQICGEALRTSNPLTSEFIILARSLLIELVETNNSGGWAGLWAKDRIQLSRNLISVCDNLNSLPQTSDEMDAFDARILKWDPTFHPWFPCLTPANSEET